MKSKPLICGVDISKNSLDVCFNDQKGRLHHLKLTNDERGYNTLLEKLGVQRTYVMENTGPYYFRLAFTLKNNGADVRVENPIVIKRFIQMNMERNKSDRKDSIWIYRFGVEREASQWHKPLRIQMHCSQMLRSIDLLKRQLTMVTNQLHSISQLPVQSCVVIRSLSRIKFRLKMEIVKLEMALHTALSRWHGKQQKDLSTIPGLGERAVAALIICTGGFTRISNHRQLIALAGLAPREHCSGSSVNKRKGICKLGNVYLRNVLYMCSLSAIKHNRACRELYTRLRESGKAGKVALVAVCNKLLKQAFSIATKGTQYQADYKSSSPPRLRNYVKTCS